jgi:D-glycero-alpha-D-manno-heptose-7-phosphate kinase
MIISRAPFRISFFGGGTDYPAWYRENGGAVIGVSINKFCYITCRFLPPFHAYKYLVRYYRREEAQTLDEIQHPAVRECIRFLGLDKGVDLVHHADLPARSGLGSSSTFTVGLLHALFALKHEMATKRQLAVHAIEIEQNVIGENVGSQDQTLAAFGGLNRIEFGGPHEIQVKPLILAPERLDALESHVMLFFTGFARTASEVAGAQIAQISRKAGELRKMMELTEQAEALLTDSKRPMADFGRLLDEQWGLKRRMSELVSSPDIDRIYEAGLHAGAIGGKLLGAGGGGFMMFFVEPESRPRVLEAMKGLLHVPVRFDYLGSQIIYFSKDDYY